VSDESAHRAQESRQCPQIAYCFADHGVEAEALSTLGDVHRFTLNPRPNPYCATTHAVDLMETTPAGEFDLWVGHPKCTRYSDMPDVNPDDHENQIPRARELAELMATDYVIENKPAAPLENVTLLNGRMFNVPLEYERAFESSFDLPQPPRQQTFGSDDVETSPFFYSERSHRWWRAVKGIRGDYPKEHVAKNALPLAYVDYIGRSWLAATGRSEGVADYSEYDAEMDERRAQAANASLSGWSE